VAREAIANEKPRFIVMMLGLNDRQLIRERVVVPRNEKPGQQGQPGSEKPAQDASTDAPEQPGRTRIVVHEFRTERWAELYGRRIDETIAVLKARGVPVFWVGLPSVRGPKSTSDMLYLNELFRARAEKAGITYIDVWDGFVDESGRFALQGPDLEGQTRRLRTGDGLHFTKAGARKLAHYVEREIRRSLSTGPVPVVLPASEPQPVVVPTALPGRPTPRPLAGPVLPLTTTPKATEELLGGDDAQVATGHATVTRVLVKGEPVESPAGRSDDFAWPRRDVAAFGKDPVAATTNLPIPVMRPLPEKTTVAVPSGETRSVSAKPSAPPKRAAQRQQQRRRQSPEIFPFFR
jgi:lysophospholipase L1-like esterase